VEPDYSPWLNHDILKGLGVPRQPCRVTDACLLRGQVDVAQGFSDRGTGVVFYRRGFTVVFAAVV